jgi:predicted tellurium resistance membrane protein TerC
MQWVFDIQIWTGLLTLTVLEIVLGIDNIIFISILAGKLPRGEQGRARTLGLVFALLTRVLLLCTLFWLIGLTKPFFTLFAHDFSGKDLVLIAGGLFLIAKSTHEIHGSLEGEEGENNVRTPGSLVSTVVQIMLLDIVFSLDSVITAVGMVQNIGVMIAAVVLAMIVMLLCSGAISDFVNRHPTIKMLALSFLLLIGVVLVADGFGQHIPKGYIYFAMAFSVGVEMLNIRARGRRKKPEPVRLHQPYQ